MTVLNLLDVACSACSLVWKPRLHACCSEALIKAIHILDAKRTSNKTVKRQPEATHHHARKYELVCGRGQVYEASCDLSHCRGTRQVQTYATMLLHIQGVLLSLNLRSAESPSKASGATRALGSRSCEGTGQCLNFYSLLGSHRYFKCKG